MGASCLSQPVVLTQTAKAALSSVGTGCFRPFSAGECARKESVGTAKADRGIWYCNRDAGCLISVKNAPLAIYRISADVNPADNLQFFGP
jgi:hypothetical protein